MSHRGMGQLSLAESIVARREQRPWLREVHELIDWERVSQRLSVLYAAREGRPSYPPVVMFRALLLQQWHQLSDPGLEAALEDRLSFREFAGLALNEQVPDHSTISRFRAQLSRRGLDEALFAEVSEQLESKRLVVKRGTLIDASLVRAAVREPDRGERGEKLGQGSPLDSDAQWTHRKGGGGSHFGYKAHVAVDLGSGLIRKVLLTGAKTNDGEVADQLICGDEGAVLADKAYDSSARRELLARLGIADGIMRRAWWGTARNPDPQLTARNRALARIRWRVERTFALMKLHYRYRRVRYRGLLRNRVQLVTMCIAINLKRALVLSSA
ncbi:MAG TPA: IS5 family transposase [Candidatus Binataceae bacterium]|nr:IS5 family transposase [Candidatus Binataceae bacterium]